MGLQWARALLEAGFGEECVELTLRLCEQRPGAVDPRLLLGQAQARLERWEEAEASLREAQDLDPDDPRPTYELARFLMERGRLEEAEDLAARAAGQRPELGDLLEEIRRRRRDGS